MSHGIDTDKKQNLDTLFNEQGYTDYKWIDPGRIIVSQWVRMKCMFGCGEYGRCAACPPSTPSVDECGRFFHEYGDAVILHFTKRVDPPEKRFVWTRKVNAELLKLERAVFLAGFERAFLLFMDSCCFCKE